jgi:predicted nuclease of predicted toxin-antitoxin system
MPLTYVLDEHLRQTLRRAIQRHNADGSFVIEVTQVGDPVDLPLGSTDPDILLWAEKEGRVVVTRDYSTMRSHLVVRFANPAR